jgi:hypothetical protein
MLRTFQAKSYLATPFSTQRTTIRTLKMDSSLHPLSGLYKPNALKGLYYGPDVVKSI